MPRCDDPSNLLLPWYLNGSLEAAEEEPVRAHLASCAICSQELAELSEIAEPLAARATEGWARRLPALFRSGRLRWAVAAGVILGVLLLAYWVRPKRAAPEEFLIGPEHVVRLDLNSGSVRNEKSLPTLALVGQVGQVDLRLGNPVNSRSTYEMELRSSQGKVLARSSKAPMKLNSLGRTTYRIEADLLYPPGEFQLVLREFDPSGAVREYPHAFRVVSLP